MVDGAAVAWGPTRDVADRLVVVAEKASDLAEFVVASEFAVDGGGRNVVDVVDSDDDADDAGADAGADVGADVADVADVVVVAAVDVGVVGLELSEDVEFVAAAVVVAAAAW